MTALPSPTDLPRHLAEIVNALRAGPALLSPRQCAEIVGYSRKYWERFAAAHVDRGCHKRGGVWAIPAGLIADEIERNWRGSVAALQS